MWLRRIRHVVKRSVSWHSDGRFKPRLHQYVVLSKTLNPHCYSWLSWEMNTMWGLPREVCLLSAMSFQEEIAPKSQRENQYVVLSKTRNPHCYSWLSWEMNTMWGLPREGCLLSAMSFQEEIAPKSQRENQYVVLSKTRNPHCYSWLSWEMNTMWGLPREGCLLSAMSFQEEIALKSQRENQYVVLSKTRNPHCYSWFSLEMNTMWGLPREGCLLSAMSFQEEIAPKSQRENQYVVLSKTRNPHCYSWLSWEMNTMWGLPREGCLLSAMSFQEEIAPKSQRENQYVVLSKTRNPHCYSWLSWEMNTMWGLPREGCLLSAMSFQEEIAPKSQRENQYVVLSKTRNPHCYSWLSWEMNTMWGVPREGCLLSAMSFQEEIASKSQRENQYVVLSKTRNPHCYSWLSWEMNTMWGLPREGCLLSAMSFQEEIASKSQRENQYVVLSKTRNPHCYSWLSWEMNTMWGLPREGCLLSAMSFQEEIASKSQRKNQYVVLSKTRNPHCYSWLSWEMNTMWGLPREGCLLSAMSFQEEIASKSQRENQYVVLSKTRNPHCYSWLSWEINTMWGLPREGCLLSAMSFQEEIASKSQRENQYVVLSKTRNPHCYSWLSWEMNTMWGLPREGCLLSAMSFQEEIASKSQRENQYVVLSKTRNPHCYSWLSWEMNTMWGLPREGCLLIAMSFQEEIASKSQRENQYVVLSKTRNPHCYSWLSWEMNTMWGLPREGCLLSAMSFQEEIAPKSQRENQYVVLSKTRNPHCYSWLSWEMNTMWGLPREGCLLSAMSFQEEIASKSQRENQYVVLSKTRNPHCYSWLSWEMNTMWGLPREGCLLSAMSFQEEIAYECQRENQYVVLSKTRNPHCYSWLSWEMNTMWGLPREGCLLSAMSFQEEIAPKGQRENQYVVLSKTRNPHCYSWLSWEMNTMWGLPREGCLLSAMSFQEEIAPKSQRENQYVVLSKTRNPHCYSWLSWEMNTMWGLPREGCLLSAMSFQEEIAPKSQRENQYVVLSKTRNPHCYSWLSWEMNTMWGLPREGCLLSAMSFQEEIAPKSQRENQYVVLSKTRNPHCYSWLSWEMNTMWGLPREGCLLSAMSFQEEIAPKSQRENQYVVLSKTRNPHCYSWLSWEMNTMWGLPREGCLLSAMSFQEEIAPKSQRENQYVVLSKTRNPHCYSWLSWEMNTMWGLPREGCLLSAMSFQEEIAPKSQRENQYVVLSKTRNPHCYSWLSWEMNTMWGLPREGCLLSAMSFQEEIAYECQRENQYVVLSKTRNPHCYSWLSWEMNTMWGLPREGCLLSAMSFQEEIAPKSQRENQYVVLSKTRNPHCYSWLSWEMNTMWGLPREGCLLSAMSFQEEIASKSQRENQYVVLSKTRNPHCYSWLSWEMNTMWGLPREGCLLSAMSFQEEIAPKSQRENQYVVLSKTHNPHCYSWLSWEMNTMWGLPREGCLLSAMSFQEEIAPKSQRENQYVVLSKTRNPHCYSWLSWEMNTMWGLPHEGCLLSAMSFQEEIALKSQRENQYVCVVLSKTRNPHCYSWLSWEMNTMWGLPREGCLLSAMSFQEEIALKSQRENQYVVLSKTRNPHCYSWLSLEMNTMWGLPREGCLLSAMSFQEEIAPKGQRENQYVVLSKTRNPHCYSWLSWEMNTMWGLPREGCLLSAMSFQEEIASKSQRENQYVVLSKTRNPHCYSWLSWEMNTMWGLPREGCLLSAMSFQEEIALKVNAKISMLCWARHVIRIATVDSAEKWIPCGDSLVKGAC